MSLYSVGFICNINICMMICVTYIDVCTIQVMPKARRTRLLRKLTGDNNSTDQQSDQAEADPILVRKKQPFLRSKSTIDIPDHSRNPGRSNRVSDRGSDVSGSDLDGPGARRGGRINNNNSRYQSKVQSAPAQMARGRAGAAGGGAAGGRRGPTDSTGRLITLDGLSKVPARKQPLSPLKAPAAQPRGRRRQAADPSDSESSPISKRKPALRSGGLISSNKATSRSTYNTALNSVAEPLGAPELSSDASHMAHIALQRAYKQQHDPVWQAQQEQQLQQQVQMQALQAQMQQQLQSLNTSFQNNFPSMVSGGTGLLSQSSIAPHSLPAGYPGTAAGMPPLDAHQQALLQQHMLLQQQQQQMQLQMQMQQQPLSTSSPYPDQLPVVSASVLPETSNSNNSNNNHSASTQHQMLASARTEKLSPTVSPFPQQQQLGSLSARKQSSPQPSPRPAAAINAKSTAPAEAPIASSLASSSSNAPTTVSTGSTAATVTAAAAGTSRRYQLGDLDSPPTQSEDEQDGEDNPYDEKPDSRQAVQHHKVPSGHSSPVGAPAQRIPSATSPGTGRGLASPTSSTGSPTGSPIPSPAPPIKELDAEEQLVEEMVNMDLDTALQRLQKYQTSSYASVKAGTDVQGDVLGYAKPGATATLAKHARNLSGHLSAAEQHLAQYRSLADGYMM